VNTIILTKLWYPLRLLKPTEKFFDLLKSTIYKFVWQNKTPRLCKDLLFLPWESGGLKAIQHQVLQRRWLDYMVNPMKYPSFVYNLMLEHLSLFDDASLCPNLPLYGAQFRKGPIYQTNMSIWSVVFSTFDYFVNFPGFLLENIPAEAILRLYLYKVLGNIDDTH
jgi:hypothetical protein